MFSSQNGHKIHLNSNILSRSFSQTSLEIFKYNNNIQIAYNLRPCTIQSSWVLCNALRCGGGGNCCQLVEKRFPIITLILITFDSNWWYFTTADLPMNSQAQLNLCTFCSPCAVPFANYSVDRNKTIPMSKTSAYIKRVQNEQFWGKIKDSFYAILKRKYSFRRDSNPDPWITRRTLYHIH